jgi:ABC-type dipeptide/oligopeptide/nickel transport system permease component
MLKFAARRLSQAILVIIAVTLATFAGLFYFGDPFKSVGEKIIPPDTQAVLHAKFGMDKPFVERYLIYLKNLFTGEFGVDFDQRRPVAQLVGAVAPNTARLALLAIAISVTIGVLAGVVAAVWRGRLLDTLITVVVILLLCIPLFVLAVILRAELAGLHVFGFELFPELPHVFGADPPWYKDVLLPAVALALGDIAFVARLMRASMLDVLGSDYLRTARAKGISEGRVILKHGVRNAIIPVVNHAGIAMGALMGGALIVETVFQYDGIGRLFIRSLLSANRPIVMAIAVLATIAFIVIVALIDVLSAYLDPRIRLT